MSLQSIKRRADAPHGPRTPRLTLRTSAKEGLASADGARRGPAPGERMQGDPTGGTNVATSGTLAVAATHQQERSRDVANASAAIASGLAGSTVGVPHGGVGSSHRPAKNGITCPPIGHRNQVLRSSLQQQSSSSILIRPRSTTGPRLPPLTPFPISGSACSRHCAIRRCPRLLAQRARDSGAQHVTRADIPIPRDPAGLPAGHGPVRADPGRGRRSEPRSERVAVCANRRPIRAPSPRRRRPTRRPRPRRRPIRRRRPPSRPPSRPQSRPPNPTAEPTPEPTADRDPRTAGPVQRLHRHLRAGNLQRPPRPAPSLRSGRTSPTPSRPWASPFIDVARRFDRRERPALADGNVSRVEVDRVRTAEADPSDSGYADQWSLPKIGWNNVFGTVTPERQRGRRAPRHRRRCLASRPCRSARPGDLDPRRLRRHHRPQRPRHRHGRHHRRPRPTTGRGSPASAMPASRSCPSPSSMRTAQGRTATSSRASSGPSTTAPTSST